MSEREKRRALLSAETAYAKRHGHNRVTVDVRWLDPELESAAADQQELSNLALLLIGVAGTLGRASECGLEGAAEMLSLVRDAACSIQRGRE